MRFSSISVCILCRANFNQLFPQAKIKQKISCWRPPGNADIFSPFTSSVLWSWSNGMLSPASQNVGTKSKILFSLVSQDIHALPASPPLLNPTHACCCIFLWLIHRSFLDEETEERRGYCLPKTTELADSQPGITM